MLEHKAGKQRMSSCVEPTPFHAASLQVPLARLPWFCVALFGLSCIPHCSDVSQDLLLRDPEALQWMNVCVVPPSSQADVEGSSSIHRVSGVGSLPCLVSGCTLVLMLASAHRPSGPAETSPSAASTQRPHRGTHRCCRQCCVQ